MILAEIVLEKSAHSVERCSCEFQKFRQKRLFDDFFRPHTRCALVHMSSTHAEDGESSKDGVLTQNFHRSRANSKLKVFHLSLSTTLPTQQPCKLSCPCIVGFLSASQALLRLSSCFTSQPNSSSQQFHQSLNKVQQQR